MPAPGGAFDSRPRGSGVTGARARCKLTVHGQIFLSHLEVSNGSEHSGVVIVQLGGLILQSDQLEALAADVAPV